MHKDMTKEELKAFHVNELKNLGYDVYTDVELGEFADLQEVHTQLPAVYSHMLKDPITGLLLFRLIRSQRKFGKSFYQSSRQLALILGISRDRVDDHLDKLRSPELGFIRTETGGSYNRKYFEIDEQKVRKMAMEWILTHTEEVNELRWIFGKLTNQEFAKNKKQIQNQAKQLRENPASKKNQLRENPASSCGKIPQLIKDNHKDNRSSTNVEEREASASSFTLAQQIKVVFEHWRKVMKHPRTPLTLDRERLIEKALKSGYGIVELCKAIDGCAKTPHNNGANGKGVHTGLNVIFGKGADQIDRFMSNDDNPPLPDGVSLKTKPQPQDDYFARYEAEQANIRVERDVTPQSPRLIEGGQS